MSGQGFPFSLVPVLDFVNHPSHGHPNSVHSFDTASKSFVLTATRDIEPNEEVKVVHIILIMLILILSDHN